MPNNLKFDYIDDDPRACDKCNKKKKCASLTALCGDVVVICKDCLQTIINQFEE